MVEETQNNNLIISIDENSDHLRVYTVGWQEGPQHPTKMQEKNIPNNKLYSLYPPTLVGKLTCIGSLVCFLQWQPLVCSQRCCQKAENGRGNTKKLTNKNLETKENVIFLKTAVENCSTWIQSHSEHVIVMWFFFTHSKNVSLCVWKKKIEKSIFGIN